MKYLRYLLIGVFFGITMYKSQAVSWYRIYEMFRFEAFHMYGIIGVAVGLGLIFVQIIKRFKVKNVEGVDVELETKSKSVIKYLVGGTIFGLGWALTGACPGPMYILVGSGALSILIVIVSAMLGTFIYGLLRNKLPH